MACEDIELRLSELKDDKKELEENLEMAPPHKKDLFEANLNRIKGDITREEAQAGATVLPRPRPLTRKTSTPRVSSGRSRSRRRAGHGCGSG